MKRAAADTIIAAMTAPISSASSAPAPGIAISILINGEPREVPEGTTLSGLLVYLGLEPRKMAIERNLEIVPKSLYGETVLIDADRIEIVQFVGGG